MCDTCMEMFAVYAVECEGAGESVDFNVVPIHLFLQEARSVAEAVLRIEKSPEQKSSSIGAILLCRILDVLQGHESDSPDYEELQRSEWVRQTIAAECAPELILAIRAMDLPFLNEDALRLYQTETYLADGKTALERLPISSASWRMVVLRHLRDWWLRGEGLEMDPDAIVPGADLTPEERMKYKRLLRVFYLALLQVENTLEERQLLLDIVAELPMHSWGLDLWLKRMALARLAKWEPLGLPVLMAENRDVLYYYAALKADMAMEQRVRLAGRLESEGVLESSALLKGVRLKNLLVY